LSTIEAQTPGNSLNIGLRAGYLSVRTAAGASDKTLTESLINGLTYKHREVNHQHHHHIVISLSKIRHRDWSYTCHV